MIIKNLIHYEKKLNKDINLLFNLIFISYSFKDI